MTPSIEIRPRAESEIDEAHGWYERRCQGLGAAFVLDLDEAFKKALRQPDLYPMVRKRIRRAPVARFPYGVFYSVEQDTIVVHAEIHDRRSKKRWPS